MTRAIGLGVLLLAHGACGSGSDGHTPAQLEARMCACKDQACIDTVDKDVEAFTRKAIAGYKRKMDMPADKRRVVDDLHAALIVCRQAVRGR